ncbi:MAG: deoxyribonuclease IV [Acidobacteria bacterium]|nr:deoxyribonuclease IV [Acidobacteriota bacterium]
MRIGIHTSIAGSLENAALKAVELGANTFQIFSASPRMWRAAALKPDQVRRFKALRKEHGLAPLAVHDNYLINLAAADPATRARSIAAFRGELERALALGAEFLVAHPGSYKGQSLEWGIEAVAAGLNQAARGLQSRRLAILLENTAGSGAQIGSRFEELAHVRALARRGMDFRLGYCIDTAHSLAAGYDVSTAEGLDQTVRELDRVLGLERVPILHANDSKAPLGSRVDRHQNIGAGYIGLEGFRRILNHPKLRSKAFLLETPIDHPDDDRRNMDTLKSLCRKSRTTIKPSR